MSLFKRLGKLLSDENNNNKDSEKIRQSIKDALLTNLNELYLTNVEATKNKELIIWMDTDSFTFYSFDGFNKELLDYISIERGYLFSEIELKIGKPDNDNECRQLKYNSEFNEITLYIQEKKKSFLNVNKARKASVSIAYGKGDLEKNIYMLSSDELKKEHKKQYNIGRQEFPTMENGNYRHNNIVIDDTKNRDINGHVSRAHAHIGYSETIGFYLQVEFDGSRLSGNRTRIIRNDEKIEVENINAKEPLIDGDLIELGKTVLLKFKEEQ